MRQGQARAEPAFVRKAAISECPFGRCGYGGGWFITLRVSCRNEKLVFIINYSNTPNFPVHEKLTIQIIEWNGIYILENSLLCFRMIFKVGSA